MYNRDGGDNVLVTGMVTSAMMGAMVMVMTFMEELM